MGSTEERPTKRRCTRDPPEDEEEEEEDDDALPKYVDAWPTWVPPSLLQLCYRTLRATGRIQELEKDGRVPKETLQKFAKWVAKSHPWQDCPAWGEEPKCNKSTEEGKAETSETVTVCTRLSDRARACVGCLKNWLLDPTLREPDEAMRMRVHIDYEGDYPKNPGPIFNDWKGPWGRIAFGGNGFEVTGYVPGKTTEDDLAKCVKAWHGFPGLYDIPGGHLVRLIPYDWNVKVSHAPNDHGSPPIFDYCYEDDDYVEHCERFLSAQDEALLLSAEEDDDLYHFE